MRTIYLAVLFLGCAHAAVQQIRSPVYQAPKAMTNNKPEPISMPATNTQQAQAREGTAVEAAPSVHQTPSQNYMIYYYPSVDQYRTNVQPAVVNSAPVEGGFLRSVPWTDVGIVVGSLALVMAGGAILYRGFGAEVKARAMRELEGFGYDDASQLARRVLRAIEKFQNMNVENQ